MGFKCGFAVLMGRTNVGKSTMINNIMGEKVSIISPKPQTTRNRIMAILTDSDSQIIFVDTPGIHRGDKPLNRFMNKTARDAAGDADIIVLMIDVSKGVEKRLKEDANLSGDRLIHPIDLEIINDLSGDLSKGGTPKILLINKIDRVEKSTVLPMIEAVSSHSIFDVIIPISALNGDGLSEFKSEIKKFIPESPPLFPEDDFTDQTERFIAGEIIREKVFKLTKQEIPYSTAVVIERFSEKGKGNGEEILVIDALIYVEKDSQKGIIIGKGGAMIKKIGIKSREDLEAFFGIKVFLDVRVKVLKDWSKSEGGIKRLGYK